MLKTPPINVPSPSVRKPRVRSLSSHRTADELAERQEHAGRFDHDTIITMHIVMIAIEIEFRHAERERVDRAPPTSLHPGRAKLTLPSASATTKPTIRPSSTADVAEEASDVFGDEHNRQQHDQRHGKIIRIAEVGCAECRRPPSSPRPASARSRSPRSRCR